MLTQTKPLPVSWRDRLSRDESVRICRHILTKLEYYYLNVSEESLEDRTSGFEAKEFQFSTSKEQYVNQIGNGLKKLEEHVINRGNTIPLWLRYLPQVGNELESPLPTPPTEQRQQTHVQTRTQQQQV